MPTVVKAYLGNVPLFDAGQSSAGYQRPADWLPLPAAEPQSVKILHAVYNQPDNYAGLRMIGNSSYQVDWGDGVVEVFASNVNAFHTYNYNNSALDGTLTSRGYKQAIIKVTALNNGVFTFCTLNLRYSTPTGLQAYDSGFLDVNINLPNITAGTRLQIGGNNVRHNHLERVNITSWGGVTLLDNLFFNCTSIQSVNETEWDMSNVASVLRLFNGCSALKSLDCSNWNISNISNWNFAFLSCGALTSFKAPTGVVPAGGSLSNMFGACYALEKLDLSTINVSNVTNMSNMFGACFSLREVNLTGWNTSAMTNASTMFSACYSLKKIPALDLSGVTTISGGTFCTNSNSLTKMEATGINVTVNMANCLLGAAALNEIYANLSSNGTGKTITVSGNHGTATDDPSIATAKGWTVVG